ncbi:ribosomal RNA small subunit methyltransferase A [Siminovitchia terrae]|uniref:23S ribosomal RNA methyltransferase Erm n=1 Tax=Siminovitchia terrae TaxID=1914933 RepID=UPI001B2A5155|nr:23S ribosomal RNA methyltransferase Erm [Siminovitchia terrae]GIN92530.1 ribosomal RNA small subunit methyltransferase A [Siminovitchia terrae]
MTTNKYKSTKKITRGAPRNFSGQHLMHSNKLIHEIVDQVKISRHDTVLDLGAGKGALTSVLSQRAGKVLAVEYDIEFVEVLKRKFFQQKNTKIIHEDILQFRLPKEPFIVVSNIPYSITTPIMKMLLNNPSIGFQRGVIVMEKGAAKRFTSNMVKDPYVIAWRMWFDIRYSKEISRKNFSPPPRVDSAMISINRKARPIVPTSDYLIFWGMVNYLFKNPRSSIDLAFKGIFTPPQIKQLKRNLGVKNDRSVASLSEQQWGIIFKTMVKHVPKFRWPKIKKAKLDHI